MSSKSEVYKKKKISISLNNEGKPRRWWCFSIGNFWLVICFLVSHNSKAQINHFRGNFQILKVAVIICSNNYKQVWTCCECPSIIPLRKETDSVTQRWTSYIQHCISKGFYRWRWPHLNHIPNPLPQN